MLRPYAQLLLLVALCVLPVEGKVQPTSLLPDRRASVPPTPSRYLTVTETTAFTDLVVRKWQQATPPQAMATALVREQCPLALHWRTKPIPSFALTTPCATLDKNRLTSIVPGV